MKVLRSLLLFICIILFFNFYPVFSEKNKEEVFIVHTPMLNIRDAPSIDANIVGTLVEGNQLHVLNRDDGWSKVSFNDRQGWVSSKFLIEANVEELEVSSQALSGFIIVIDPGHGGKDPGAIGINGVLEKDLILTTSRKIAEKLTELGAKVVLTRTDDYFVSLDERINISHAHNADAFISVHYNAFNLEQVQGFSTYYYSSPANRELAESIHSSLAEEVNLHNRGLLEDDYLVLRKNQRPSALIELGFITNSTDLQTLQSEGYQNVVTNAVANGLINYFNGD